MKVLFGLIICLFPLLLFSQSNISVATATAIKRSKHHVLTPDSLARYLTAGYTKDIDKVRSIFTWIAGNIEYNSRPARNAVLFASRYNMEDEDTGALKPLDERVAIEVLEKKIAFCDGYAKLFKTLCDYAGVKSTIITGYAYTGIRRPKFSSNHRWNAVYLDSAWHLLDVTWSSGYVTYNSDYVQHFNDKYFLTPASVFVNDHYPEDPQWALLPQPPSPVEFKISPFKTNAYVRNRITNNKPETGVIEASVGDTLNFEMESGSEIKKLLLVDTAYVDSAYIANASLADTTKFRYTISGNNIHYSYFVTSPDVKWLQVIFNDEVVMRYKINIRKDEIAAK